MRGFVRTHFLPFTRSDRESRTTLHLLNLWKHLTLRGFETLFLHFSFCLFLPNPTQALTLLRQRHNYFVDTHFLSSSFCTSRASQFGRDAAAVLQFAVDMECRYHEPTQKSGTPSLYRHNINIMTPPTRHVNLFEFGTLNGTSHNKPCIVFCVKHTSTSSLTAVMDAAQSINGKLLVATSLCSWLTELYQQRTLLSSTAMSISTRLSSFQHAHAKRDIGPSSSLNTVRLAKQLLLSMMALCSTAIPSLEVCDVQVSEQR